MCYLLELCSKQYWKWVFRVLFEAPFFFFDHLWISDCSIFNNAFISGWSFSSSIKLFTWLMKWSWSARSKESGWTRDSKMWLNSVCRSSSTVKPSPTSVWLVDSILFNFFSERNLLRAERCKFWMVFKLPSLLMLDTNWESINQFGVFHNSRFKKLSAAIWVAFGVLT